MLDKQRKKLYLRTEILEIQKESQYFKIFVLLGDLRESVEEDSRQAELDPSDFAEKNGSTRKLRQIQRRNEIRINDYQHIGKSTVTHMIHVQFGFSRQLN